MDVHNDRAMRKSRGHGRVRYIDTTPSEGQGRDLRSCMSPLLFVGRLTESINRQMLTLASLVPILLMAAVACVLSDTPPTRTLPESIARHLEQTEQTAEVSGTPNGGAQPTDVPLVQDVQPSRNAVPEVAAPPTPVIPTPTPKPSPTTRPDVVDQPPPEPGVTGPPERDGGPFVSVAAGRYHSCAVRDDGSIACWGKDEFSQATPRAGRFVSVSAELDHTCGVMDDGSVACWGKNLAGSTRPPGGSFASVEAGWGFTCGVKDDDSITCWGRNLYGELNPPQGTFVGVSPGAIHACGLKDDGTVACWGKKDYGLLNTPQGPFVSVTAGGAHTCGLREEGSVVCWGLDDAGQATPPQGRFTSIDGGEKHTCGVKDDGEVSCWGANHFRQSAPRQGSYASVSAGSRHTCGLKTDGSVSCWGRTNFGGDVYATVDAGYGRICGAGGRRDDICRAWSEPSKPRPTPVRVATGFAECIPEDLYQHLLSIDLIDNLEYLRTVNWAATEDLGSSYVPEICPTVDVVLTADEEPKVYNDNVFVLPIPEDLIAEQSLDPAHHTPRFYEYFDDEFDFLIFVTSLYQFEEQRLGSVYSFRRGANPQYHRVSNGVPGIGLPIFSNAEKLGSRGKLQGLVRLPTYRTMAHQGIVLHEIMHRWGAYITGGTQAHWNFSSAYGLLGGFDIAALMDLGEGNYAVRDKWVGGGSFGGPVVYSPIELYVAGFLPMDDVPNLWVGEDAEWVRDQSGEVALAQGGYRIFKPGKVRTYTIEDIVAKHGKRVPDSSQSQKDFRAAVIMLIDENHPATKWQLDQLSSYVAAFSFPGESHDGMYNFYEATGGRGTIAMGGLSEFLK